MVIVIVVHVNYRNKFLLCNFQIVQLQDVMLIIWQLTVIKSFFCVCVCWSITVLDDDGWIDSRRMLVWHSLWQQKIHTYILCVYFMYPLPFGSKCGWCFFIPTGCCYYCSSCAGAFCNLKKERENAIFTNRSTAVIYRTVKILLIYLCL